jgi:hypothetical protein
MAEPFKGRMCAINISNPSQALAALPSWVKTSYRNPEGIFLGFESEADLNKYKESIK